MNCDKADVEEFGDVGKDFCVTALQKRELPFCWQSTKTGTSFNDGMKRNILFVPRNTVFDFIGGFFLFKMNRPQFHEAALRCAKAARSLFGNVSE